MEKENPALKSLQIAAENAGLTVYEYFNEDKRKTVQKYFVRHHGVSVSPVLDYENLNHFILGWIKAKKTYL